MWLSPQAKAFGLERGKIVSLKGVNSINFRPETQAQHGLKMGLNDSFSISPKHIDALLNLSTEISASVYIHRQENII